jgi:hypothetical protein
MAAGRDAEFPVDRDRLRLDGVGVLARIEDAPMIQERLTELDGATSSHDVVDEAALQAAAAEPSA